MAGADESPVIEDVIETVEKVIENNADSNVQLERTERLLKFPLTRIKTIMKTDSDVTIASLDAVVLIAKATVRTERGSVVTMIHSLFVPWPIRSLERIGQ